MTRSLKWAGEGAALGALLVATALVACGCATGTSAVAGMTYQKSSVYRSATAHVALAPEDAFNPAVKLLLERGDIDVTKLKESESRCSAVAGKHKLTLRVVEAGPGRSRLSMLVGGGHDPEANQELADELVRRICSRLSVQCE